jgi:hypothetical protein
MSRVFLPKDSHMIDPQSEATQTEQHAPEDLPERLPWVSPRLDSIKFQDAQLHGGGSTDFTISHS